ncbi:Cys-tRNA(Pro) deacylase [Litoribrevibacter albus]|uniref:Cys-tRNA(Pro)/Cys-tRNA(Cys) deacylase n=1 Tax=Litoribrevibacter albus TaxID=1473156 RepID=A0AA37S9L4_9GAMM|nr:Cys-tRNA(Pro) deacylase [Litoribrevibacter albus]GLQ30785.1 Cys-tRNA(Pro)/Cys-tRNA(Cys) deacylase [Litoribrevibacter albus]
MTPAINVAKKAKISFQVHQYEHDANAESYGLEAAEKLNIDPSLVFKTLLAEVDKQLVVAVLPVSHQLNLKSCAASFKAKKAVMAKVEDAERATGYVVGGISPLGQKKRLKMVIDSSAQHLQTIFVSAGRRGLEIELASSDLAQLTGAIFADVCA